MQTPHTTPEHPAVLPFSPSSQLAQDEQSTAVAQPAGALVPREVACGVAPKLRRCMDFQGVGFGGCRV